MKFEQLILVKLQLRYRTHIAIQKHQLDVLYDVGHVIIDICYSYL